MDPTLLIILIFFVAPLIEKLLKAGKQEEEKRPLPRQRPGPHIEPRSERELPERGPERGIEVRMPPAQREKQRRPDGGPAADVLPDDLWEILTGERRTSLPTPPPPDSAYDEPYEPEPEEAEVSYDDVAPPEVLPVPGRMESPRRPARGHSYDEMLPVREPPRVVSMEQTSFDDAVRHRQFHDRLDNLPPRARVQRRRHPRAADFMTDADLRRAIIMTEILGPPKGLQQGD